MIGKVLFLFFANEYLQFIAFHTMAISPAPPKLKNTSENILNKPEKKEEEKKQRVTSQTQYLQPLEA